MRAVGAVGVVVAVAALAVGCSSDGEQRAGSADAILYTKGASTDPYGWSRPHGFGVVLAPETPHERMVEISDRNLGWFNGASWLDKQRILVPRKAPPLAPPLIFRRTRHALRLVGPAPIPRIEIGPSWSPDASLVASEPIAPCGKRQRTLWRCFRGSARVIVRNGDGSNPRDVATGHIGGWTPAGRLLLTDAGYSAAFDALDVDSGDRRRPLSPAAISSFIDVTTTAIGPPRWSGDRRFVAATIGARWPKSPKTVSAIVIARSDGKPVQVLRSPYIISMFAWSPVGHRLAYTTSGFPNPHELFVLDEPAGERIRLYVTPAHFDWITWSPEGRRLLLDEAVRNRWRVFTIGGKRDSRTLRRLGGRPLWCCPVNNYATLNG